jgi:hypothetical protein
MGLSIVLMTVWHSLAVAYFGQDSASAAVETPTPLSAALGAAHANDSAAEARSSTGAHSAPAKSQLRFQSTHLSSSAEPRPRARNRPHVIATEITSIDPAHRSQNVTQLTGGRKLQPVRDQSSSQLLRAKESPRDDEAIRVGRRRVTQAERATTAARTIEVILAKGHRRDREVAAIRKRIAAAARTHARGYQAVGFIQPSAQESEGRKLYVLVGTSGKTVAYLDLPPGLDPAALLTQRVGVRGMPHYSEDLGTRLVRVSAIESLDSR